MTAFIQPERLHYGRRIGIAIVVALSIGFWVAYFFVPHFSEGLVNAVFMAGIKMMSMLFTPAWFAMLSVAAAGCIVFVVFNLARRRNRLTNRSSEPPPVV